MINEKTNKKHGLLFGLGSAAFFMATLAMGQGAGTPVFVTNDAVTVQSGNNPVVVTYGSSDPFFLALTQTTPNLIQDAFQDMKNYLGLNILKYSEQQARLDAIAPPDASLSKSNGSFILLNQTFVDYWQSLFEGSTIKRNLLTPSGTNADSNIVGRHLVNYCSNPEAKKGICSPASYDNNGNYLGASDLNANSILGYASFPDSATNPSTGKGGTPSSVQVAAVDFVNMLTNPAPIQIPSDAFQSSANKVNTTNIRGQHASYLPTSSTGDMKLSALYKASAMMSVPQVLLMNMIAERTQVPGLGASLGIGDQSKKDISEWEALQFEATRRFASEAWHDGINNSPPTAILREIANIGAMQLAMQFRQIQQNEEIKLLLAAQVSYMAQSQVAGAASQANSQQTPQLTQ